MKFLNVPRSFEMSFPNVSVSPHGRTRLFKQHPRIFAPRFRFMPSLLFFTIFLKPSPFFHFGIKFHNGKVYNILSEAKDVVYRLSYNSS